MMSSVRPMTKSEPSWFLKPASAVLGWPGEAPPQPAGRRPVPRHVDDVVGAAHDEERALLVLEAGIGGLVVAGKFREVARPQAVIVLPKGRQACGRQRQLDDDRAHCP